MKIEINKNRKQSSDFYRMITEHGENNNNNNNNLHLYSANLYMNIFGCALQYCYIKFMLKVTKA